MAPYEALYKRKCRSPIGWFDVGESGLDGPDLVQQAIEKVKLIRDRLLTAQSRQKSYSDVRRRDLEFGVDVWITEDLSYEEIPLAVLDRQIRKLRNKEVASVKVLWKNNNVEEIDMKSRYPYLFPPPEKDPTETS
ncbi:PREDICTED: uncharacterized protein LOC109215830 [Nicotiana attenuata]|uniref:uncharacterized protein LOC109215830 n=1 Tax=Nicotiana attenuata TaxID=49451 RepID=UPI000904FF50|nr:PREDICTED: uncharacterized protein LOC109215830 [Nicotiana attenuata]